MISRERFIDLLAMSRFANLPTVWSNGFLGALIGWTLSLGQRGAVDALDLLLMALALSFLYLGGCFLNDAHDVEFDKRTRPDRPIPAGRWNRKTILFFALILKGLGLALCLIVSVPSGLFALGIIICIFAYTKWHKVTAWSFVFMAGARALIYPTAAYSFYSWNQFENHFSNWFSVFLALSFGLGGYILGISLTAKSESTPNPPTPKEQAIPVACLCAPTLFVASPLILFSPDKAAVPLLLFLVILVFSVRSVRGNHNVGLFVSRTLAAIPLVDCLAVVPIAPHPVFWFICPVLALTALGLQRIAPAT